MHTQTAAKKNVSRFSTWSLAIVTGAFAAAVGISGTQAAAGGTTWDAPKLVASGTTWDSAPAGDNGTTWDSAPATGAATTNGTTWD